MYWQDRYKSPAQAIAVLNRAARGEISLTPQESHIANVAARSALNGISEDPDNLAGLKSDIKKALKSTNVAKIQSALTRESAKLAKAPASKKAVKRADYVNQLQAQLLVAQATPSTAVLPGAPEQPIPQLPALTTDPASFAQGSSGGGGGGFTPTAVADPAATAEDAGGLPLPVMIGIGVAGLLVLYLLVKKH